MLEARTASIWHKASADCLLWNLTDLAMRAAFRSWILVLCWLQVWSVRFLDVILFFFCSFCCWRKTYITLTNKTLTKPADKWSSNKFNHNLQFDAVRWLVQPRLESYWMICANWSQVRVPLQRKLSAWARWGSVAAPNVTWRAASRRSLDGSRMAAPLAKLEASRWIRWRMVKIGWPHVYVYHPMYTIPCPIHQVFHVGWLTFSKFRVRVGGTWCACHPIMYHPIMHVPSHHVYHPIGFHQWWLADGLCSTIEPCVCKWYIVWTAGRQSWQTARCWKVKCRTGRQLFMPLARSCWLPSCASCLLILHFSRETLIGTDRERWNMLKCKEYNPKYDGCLHFKDPANKYETCRRFNAFAWFCWRCFGVSGQDGCKIMQNIRIASVCLHAAILSPPQPNSTPFSCPLTIFGPYLFFKLCCDMLWRVTPRFVWNSVRSKETTGSPWAPVERSIMCAARAAIRVSHRDLVRESTGSRHGVAKGCERSKQNIAEPTQLQSFYYWIEPQKIGICQ